MKEWDVYLDGKYVGTVHEHNEAAAACAALSKFDPPEGTEISVFPRN